MPSPRNGLESTTVMDLIRVTSPPGGSVFPPLGGAKSCGRLRLFGHIDPLADRSNKSRSSPDSLVFPRALDAVEDAPRGPGRHRDDPDGADNVLDEVEELTVAQVHVHHRETDDDRHDDLSRKPLSSPLIGSGPKERFPRKWFFKAVTKCVEAVGEDGWGHPRKGTGRSQGGVDQIR